MKILDLVLKAKCQNNCDMVTGVDAALGQVAYDLIYERKTDKDYE